MHVHARLASSYAHIDPNVVAVRCEPELRMALSLAKQLKNGALLVRRHLEKTGHVTFGYDKQMAKAQRIAVEADVGE